MAAIFCVSIISILDLLVERALIQSLNHNFHHERTSMEKFDRERYPDQAIYRIEVRGRLDEIWSEWFSGMMIAFEDDITTLTGSVVDQASLRGMLSRVWDLNLTLISVNRIESGKDKIHLHRGDN